MFSIVFFLFICSLSFFFVKINSLPATVCTDPLKLQLIAKQFRGNFKVVQEKTKEKIKKSMRTHGKH